MFSYIDYKLKSIGSVSIYNIMQYNLEELQIFILTLPKMEVTNMYQKVINLLLTLVVGKMTKKSNNKIIYNLLDKGAEPNSLKYPYLDYYLQITETAIKVVIDSNLDEIFTILSKYINMNNYVDSYIRVNVIQYCITVNKLKYVQKLLDIGIHNDVICNDGNTTIFYATGQYCKSNNLEYYDLVKSLLNIGFPIDCGDSVDSLVIAVIYANEKMIQLLLDNGVITMDVYTVNQLNKQNLNKLVQNLKKNNHVLTLKQLCLLKCERMNTVSLYDDLKIELTDLTSIKQHVQNNKKITEILKNISNT